MEPETPKNPAPEEGAATTPEPVLGRDGLEYDPQRAMATINKLREVEKAGTQTQKTLDAIRRALGVQTDLPSEPAAPTVDAAPLYEKTLRDVGKLLGLTDEVITAPGGSEALIRATKGARLSGQLTSALVEAGVSDLALARSAVNLDGVDPTSANLPAQLKEIVSGFLIDHPSMRKPTMPSVSGAAHLTGAAGGPQFLTRDQMAFMSPQAIQDARKAGLIEGFSRS